jgi:hypothetical protein
MRLTNKEPTHSNSLASIASVLSVGAPDVTVDITPAMIKAGVEELESFSREFEMEEDAAERILKRCLINI